MSTEVRVDIESPTTDDQPARVIRWRRWPLADHPQWSWLAPAGMLLIGGVAAFFGGSWWWGIAAVLCLAVTLWQFIVPTNYEVNSAGISMQVFGRGWLLPWESVAAFQPRNTGIVLYDRPDPTSFDVLRSKFLPYSDDEDEALCAVRHFLPHAVELPP